MKRLLLLPIILVLTLSFVFASMPFDENQAYAANPTLSPTYLCKKSPGVCLAIVLTNTSEPQDFTLSGKVPLPGIENPVPFTGKQSGSTYYYYALISGAAGLGTCTSSEQTEDDIVVTATEKSGSGNGSSSYELCNDTDESVMYVYTMPVNSTAAEGNGSIAGTLTYAQSATANASVNNQCIANGGEATLTGPAKSPYNSTYNLTFTDTAVNGAQGSIPAGYFYQGSLHSGTYTLNVKCLPPTPPDVSITGTCNLAAGQNITNVVTSSSCNITNTSPPVSITQSSGPQPTCQETGGPLSWLTCAIINGISTLETKVESLLEDVLTTPLIDLNSSDCKAGTVQQGDQNYTACIYNVWSQFRVFGDIVLVVLLLVIIISEAAGGGLLNAYSIRKILPRLLMVAVLINISIYLMAGMVDITNIFGHGIFDLLTIPFKSTGTYTINITAGAGGAGNFIGGTAAVGGTLTAIFIGSGIAYHTLWSSAGSSAGDALGFFALFVLLPAVLAILGVLLTIFFRAVLIVVLLMVSPIAFALYCLPNTERVFRKWWDILFKTLMVFPVVMVIFALCDVGSVVVSSFSDGGTPWVGELMAVLGVTAPLFLVPFAFKVSGGVIGNVHGALTTMGHKVNEGIKGNPNDQDSLQNRTRRRFATRRAAAGLTWGAVGTRLNPRRITPTGRENERARLSVHKQAGQELLRRQMEETPYWRTISGDSRILKQLAEYRNGREARTANNSWRDAQVAAGKDAAETQREYDLNNAAIAAAERTGWNPVARRSALLNPNYIKFGAGSGVKGWNKSMMLAKEMAGGTSMHDAKTGEITSAGGGYDQFQFAALQNEFQSTAKGPAGRVDLAGNTDGKTLYNANRGWTSQGLSVIGQGSGAAITGTADYYDQLLTRASEAEQMYASATTDADKAQALEYFKRSTAADGLDVSDFTNDDALVGRDPITGPIELAQEAAGAFTLEARTLNSSISSGTVRDAAIAAEDKMRASITRNSTSKLDLLTDPNVVRKARTMDDQRMSTLLGMMQRGGGGTADTGGGTGGP